MRSNPLVCVELDEIVDDTQWMSIIIFGSYKELPDSQESEEGCNFRPPDLALESLRFPWIFPETSAKNASGFWELFRLSWRL